MTELINGVGFQIQFFGERFHTDTVQTSPNQMTGAVGQFGDAIEQPSYVFLLELVGCLLHFWLNGLCDVVTETIHCIGPPAGFAPMVVELEFCDAQKPSPEIRTDFIAREFGESDEKGFLRQVLGIFQVVHPACGWRGEPGRSRCPCDLVGRRESNSSRFGFHAG